MAKLILSLDGQLIKEYDISKERTTIGRKPHNDIQIDNLAVSGEHAMIMTILNDSFLEDLGSTNGTMVNGQPVKKHFLQGDDVVEIGKYKLKYVNDKAGQVSQQEFEKTMVLRAPVAAQANAPKAPATDTQTTNTGSSQPGGAQTTAAGVNKANQTQTTTVGTGKPGEAQTTSAGINKANQTQTTTVGTGKPGEAQTTAAGANKANPAQTTTVGTAKPGQAQSSASAANKPNETQTTSPQAASLAKAATKIEANTAQAAKAQQDPTNPPTSAGSDTVGNIQILSGPNAGRELPLSKPLTTLGKPGMQVAVIAKRPQGYFITHVEGANFPVVNGKPLDAQAQKLQDHDIIDLAGVKMEFFLKS